MKFKNETELLEFTSNIKGKTFEELTNEGLSQDVLKIDKGSLGKIVERDFYKYANNNNKTADFEELGIELKVTGYKKNKNGSYSAKERLSLSQINFHEIIHETFEYSHIIGKCKKMLIIWYEYDAQKEVKDFTITDFQLYDMSKDMNIFKNDFEIIKNKVLVGKAHELSEGDTSYLGACTKAKNSNDRTSQPNSDIPAKPRAYSLKNSYMTGILRESIETKLITLTKFKTAEDYIKEKFKPYFGKTQIEIYESITGAPYTKNIPNNFSKMISDRIIGKDKDLPKLNDLFSKTRIMIKNTSLNKDETPKERLSFRRLKLDEFNNNWDDSEWKQFFEETTFIIIGYIAENDEKNGFRKLHSVKKVSFSGEEIDLFEKTYNQTKLAIENNDIKLLPVSSNGFKDLALELAPKGKKGKNYANFFEKNTTETCFMISKDLVDKKLKE